MLVHHGARVDSNEVRYATRNENTHAGATTEAYWHEEYETTTRTTTLLTPSRRTSKTLATLDSIPVGTKGPGKGFFIGVTGFLHLLELRKNTVARRLGWG